MFLKVSEANTSSVVGLKCPLTRVYTSLWDGRTTTLTWPALQGRKASSQPPCERPSPWRRFRSPRNHGPAPANEATSGIFLSPGKSPCSAYDRLVFDWMPLLSQKMFCEVPEYSWRGHLCSVVSLTYSSEKGYLVCVKHIRLEGPGAGLCGVTHCGPLCRQAVQWRSETDLDVQDKPWRPLVH